MPVGSEGVKIVVATAALGVTTGLFGAFVGAAGSTALLAFSGDRAATLEQELLRKKAEARDMEHNMSRVQQAMSDFQSEEEKLVRGKLYFSDAAQSLCPDV